MNASGEWYMRHEHEESTPVEKRSKLICERFSFVFCALVGGSLVGVAWLGPEYSLLGILGLGLFFHGQLGLHRLRWRLLQSVIFGYASFAITNSWMIWTIANTTAIASEDAFVFSQLIHLFHAGMFVLFSFFGWIAEKKVRNGWLLLPMIFVAAEMIWPSLFPFRQGCLLFATPPLVQSVSVFGVSAASLQIVLLSSLLPLGLVCFGRFDSQFQIGREQAKRAVLIVILISLCNFCWGTWRIWTTHQAGNSFAGNKTSIAVIQNDTSYATFHVDLMSHSRDLGDDCDLIVWPECSIGHFDRSLTSFADYKSLSKLSYGYGFESFRPLPAPECHLLAGGFSSSRCEDSLPQEVETKHKFDDEQSEPQLDSKYVTAFLISPEEAIVGRHDKTRLMAGGEYVPAQWLVSKIKGWLAALKTNPEEVEQSEEFEADPSNHRLSRGVSAQPIGEVGGLAIGALLCCEDMYSSISRELTINGADILICLANGASFNEPAALHQHFVISRFRAIENNRHLLRCGSLGGSALITPMGDITESLPCFENGQMHVEIPIEQRQFSVFTRYGSWPLFALFGLSYFVIGRSAWLNRNDENRADKLISEE